MKVRASVKKICSKCKVIRRNQQESPVFYENFLKEIETLGQLDHPNMVRAFDALEFDGYLFLVMELLDGESLRGLATRRCCFSLREVLGVEVVCRVFIAVDARREIPLRGEGRCP